LILIDISKRNTRKLINFGEKLPSQMQPTPQLQPPVYPNYPPQTWPEYAKPSENNSQPVYPLPSEYPANQGYPQPQQPSYGVTPFQTDYPVAMHQPGYAPQNGYSYQTSYPPQNCYPPQTVNVFQPGYAPQPGYPPMEGSENYPGNLPGLHAIGGMKVCQGKDKIKEDCEINEELKRIRHFGFFFGTS
jgi:hypothetical protein